MPLDAARWQIDILAADKTASAFRSVEQRMSSLAVAQKAIGGDMASAFTLASRAVAPFAAALTAAAIAQKVFTAGIAAGELKAQAEQIGLTTDQLQAYRLVAAQSGVSSEQLDSAMMQLTRQMGAAAGGSDEVIARFDRLGVKLLDNTGRLRKAADVAPELARGLLAMGSETERNANLMELFGRSGGRMVTILGELARGNEALVASAREQSALIGGETIRAWDELSSRLKVAEQRMDTLLATAGKPIADVGLILLNTELGKMVSLLQAAKEGWDYLKGNIGLGPSSTSSEDLLKRREAMEEWVKLNRESNDALDVARLADYRRQIAGINDELARRAKIVVLPEVTVPGSRQPVGNQARAAGESEAARSLRETQKQMDELFASIEKVRQDAAGVMDRYGDGTAYAARETGKLNEMLQLGFVDASTHARALDEVARKADDMARAYRGAAGGVDAFIAGLEQGMVDMERANSAFEVGRRAISALDEVIDMLGGRSAKTFDQIAGDFALMLAKMAAQAAVSDIWKGIMSATGGGGGILNFFSGLFGGGGGGGGGLDMFSGGGLDLGFFAAGGRPPVGMPSIVGEAGPELFVPDRAGTIYPSGTGPAGAAQIVVSQTVMVGSVVSQAQHEADLRAVRQSAMDGARAALLEDVKSGGSTRRIIRG